MTPNSENKRVWFITGASKGLGYAFTCAALKAGDKVVAVARTIDNLAKLKETYPETLLPLSLDVTDKEAVFSTVETAVKHFGSFVSIRCPTIALFLSATRLSSGTNTSLFRNLATKNCSLWSLCSSF